MYYFYTTCPYPYHAYPNYRYCPACQSFSLVTAYPERYNDWRTTARVDLKDYGRQPFVVNIEEAAEQNNTFRTALWTGNHLQVTLMCIQPGGDIGLEIHHEVDQFLRIEEGQGVVQMGESESNLNFQRNVYEDSAIMVPAGTWHNLINTGNNPLNLYTIYAPPEHQFGTVHATKAEAIAAEYDR